MSRLLIADMTNWGTPRLKALGRIRAKPFGTTCMDYLGVRCPSIQMEQADALSSSFVITIIRLVHPVTAEANGMLEFEMAHQFLFHGLYIDSFRVEAERFSSNHASILQRRVKAPATIIAMAN